MDSVSSVRDGLLSPAVDMTFALQKNAQVSCVLMLCLLGLDLKNAMRMDKRRSGCVGVIVA